MLDFPIVTWSTLPMFRFRETIDPYAGLVDLSHSGRQTMNAARRSSKHEVAQGVIAGANMVLTIFTRIRRKRWWTAPSAHPAGFTRLY